MSDKAQQTISYKPLDSSRSEIRVLRICSSPARQDPGESNADDDSPGDASEPPPLTFTLHTVSLDDPSLTYFALSYV